MPAPGDAAAVWQLVRDAGALDLNSPYAYLLLCSDFRETGVVAPAEEGRLGGFVLGYRRPSAPDAWFVWQVAVAPEQRGRGLAGQMLAWVMDRHPDVRFLEATVTPSNEASRALFRGHARRYGLDWSEEMAFPKALFPAGDHEDEVRIRIGPRG